MSTARLLASLMVQPHRVVEKYDAALILAFVYFHRMYNIFVHISPVLSKLYGGLRRSNPKQGLHRDHHEAVVGIQSHPACATRSVGSEPDSRGFRDDSEYSRSAQHRFFAFGRTRTLACSRRYESTRTGLHEPRPQCL